MNLTCIKKILRYIWQTLVGVSAGIGVLAILYVVLLFFAFDTFHVPTESMTPTIKPGYRGVINKLKLGGRVFNPYAADEGRDYTVRRMPGYGKLEKGDIIVFNATYKDSWDSIAMNMRLYYCKRAVAVAGDTLSVCNGYYKVNGYNKILGVKREQDHLRATVTNLEKFEATEGMPGWVYTIPHDSIERWTIKDMGPLVIPAEGLTIELDRLRTLLYRKYIAWETGERVEWADSCARIGGKRADRYTFTENYCFAAGDHAIDSQDSRYWGLVPEKFIVGVKL
jgi:signal peptidase I